MNRLSITLISLCLTVSGCSATTSEGLYEEGSARLLEGNPHASIIFFRNAIEKNQNFLLARYQLARVYVATGEYELAEREFQKVARLNPNHPDIRHDLEQLHNCMKKSGLDISQP